MPLWSCRIGEVEEDTLVLGADAPMREAVRKAYVELTGKEPKFIFSGWGEELSDVERDVVEGR